MIERKIGTEESSVAIVCGVEVARNMSPLALGRRLTNFSHPIRNEYWEPASLRRNPLQKNIGIRPESDTIAGDTQ